MDQTLESFKAGLVEKYKNNVIPIIGENADGTFRVWAMTMNDTFKFEETTAASMDEAMERAQEINDLFAAHIAEPSKAPAN